MLLAGIVSSSLCGPERPAKRNLLLIETKRPSFQILNELKFVILEFIAATQLYKEKTN